MQLMSQLKRKGALFILVSCFPGGKQTAKYCKLSHLCLLLLLTL